jgi:hypothetical protein
MSDKDLNRHITSFVKCLLKKQKIKHAGNCLAMSQILKPYLRCMFDIDTLIYNVKVKQGRRMVNHYYLERISGGKIIDGTASQFIYPNGKKMPQVYIGELPDFYIKSKGK